MSDKDFETISFTDYIRMAKIAIKGMEDLQHLAYGQHDNLDPTFIAYSNAQHDLKVKALEEELSNAYDLIKVLAYLYHNSYITNMNLTTGHDNNNNSQSMLTSILTSIHESPLEKMKRLIPSDIDNVSNMSKVKSYSPKLKRRVLPDSTAAMIRTMLEAGVPNSVIAKQLDVDSGVISGISAGLTYRGVELPISQQDEQEEQDNN